MEMHQIRYFLAVAETLNFTQAAERCHVSQPALTRAIQLLEAELGGRLIHREGRNTSLSELGRIMHPYFEKILDAAQSAKQAAKELETLDKGELHIGAMCTIGPSVVSDFLAAFSEQYPPIELHVSVRSLKELKDDLISGRIEVALLAEPGEIDPRLHGVALFTERFVLVVSASHRLANADVVPCAELDGERYINRTNCEFYDFVHEQFLKRGIRTRRIFSSECDGWVSGMIKAGLGVGYFPEFAVNDPDLIAKPLVDPEFSRTINFVTVRGRPHSPAVGAIVRKARAHGWPARPATRL